MSKTYSDLHYTQYPDEIDTFNRVMDVTSDLLPLVKQYQNYYSNGKFNEATALLMQHPELKQCLINAELINHIIDATKAMQKLYKDDVQSYIMNLVKFFGTYSDSISYPKYAVVTFNNEAYMCVINEMRIGTKPTDTTAWVQLTLKGDQGIPGLGLHFTNAWDSGTTYVKDAAVAYNNKLFYSKKDNNINHTPTENEWWGLVVDFNGIVEYNNESSTLTSTTVQTAITEVNTKVDENTTNITNIINTVNGISASSLGLGNVDNTHDKDKHVSYADNSGNADTLDGYHHDSFIKTNASCNKNWNWNGQEGQPSWVWGSNNGTDMYIYNPSNFNVNYASSSGNADTIDSIHVTYDVHNQYGLRSIAADTFELESGVTSLGTGLIYIQYE